MPGHNSKPTIEDVAREAGVSQTTVSFVLSGSKHADRISQDTKQRIKAIAERLGYSRNPIGTALQRGYSDTVVLLIVTWNLASTLSETTVAISRAVSRSGLVPVVLVAADNDEAISLIRSIGNSLNPYGLLLLWDSEFVPDYVFTDILAEGVPIVDLMPSAPQGMISVTADREQGFYALVQYIARLGHRRIGMLIETTSRWKTSNVKLAGYRRGLKDAGITFDASLLQEIESPGFEAGYKGLGSLIERNPDVTAVVCLNDAVALGAVASAQDRGLVVPDDLSVAGYGAHSEGTYLRPHLTTLAVPSSRIAEYAVEAIVNMRTKEKYKPVSIYVPMELVIRESTGPPSR